MNEIITALINSFEIKQLEKITSNTYKELQYVPVREAILYWMWIRTEFSRIQNITVGMNQALWKHHMAINYPMAEAVRVARCTFQR